MSIIINNLYKINDLVEMTCDINDYDTGEILLSKGQQGLVSNILNPEYLVVKIPGGSFLGTVVPDRFINVYVLNLTKIWNNSLQLTDKVVASKDIYDQTSHTVLIPRGTPGIVTKIPEKIQNSDKGFWRPNTNPQWVKVRFEGFTENDQGVHISEIEKINPSKTVLSRTVIKVLERY